jgi:hypothetical protein
MQANPEKHGPLTRITKVQKDGHDGVFVTFSDGSTAGYIVEELLALRPIRERPASIVKFD